VGNRRFRLLCEISLEKYSAAQSKTEKSVVVMSIVDAIRKGSEGSIGFVKRDPVAKAWVEVGEATAREKVGQQLRELIAQGDPALIKKRKEDRKRRLMKYKMRRKSAAAAAPDAASVPARTESPFAVDDGDLPPSSSHSVRSAATAETSASPIGAVESLDFFDKNVFAVERLRDKLLF